VAVESHRASLSSDAFVLRPANVIEVQLATQRAPLSSGLELIEG
jgi:hypothetical protein